MIYKDNSNTNTRNNSDITNNTIQTIRMTCRSCNGTLTIDEESPILICPFCGSKELIIENSAVTVERIRNKTIKDIELEKINANKEIEKEKIAAFYNNYAIAKEAKKMEYKAALHEEDRIAALKFKRSDVPGVTVIFLLLALAGVGLAIIDNNDSSRNIAILQCVLCVLAWLIGFRGIKIRVPGIPHACLILTFVLAAPYLGYTMNEYEQSLLEQRYNWPTTGILSILPEPDSKSGTIAYNSDSSGRATIYGCSQSQFEDYYEHCSEIGFNQEVSSDSSSYDASNSDQYKLSIYFHDYNSSMEIYLSHIIISD